MTDDPEGRERVADNEIRDLLREIRDEQRAHVEEHRRAAAATAEKERELLARQQRAARTARRLALGVGTVVLALLALLVFLLARWWRYLFHG